MIFEPSALRVNDKVGVRPRSDMREKLHDIATVSKVTKTQITVTFNNGKTQRFIRDTGKEYGADRWHHAHLVTVTDAEKANEITGPRIKRRVTLYKLSDRLKGAGADTFTQRQLDAAMMALGDSKGGIYPPVRTDLRDFEELAKPSIDVLVKVKNHAGVNVGRYIHGLNEWNVNGFGGDAPNVIEWWPMPGELA